MIVDYLTYTFAEEYEDNPPDLAKAVDLLESLLAKMKQEEISYLGRVDI